ncbi:hypothetical protein ATCC90586_006042 [Pythium insidiosum]|nr:hypothetical protein ATCC90586_006042 [Pythium insidiosum]
MAADEDIDSLLEQGIKAAAAERHEAPLALALCIALTVSLGVSIAHVAQTPPPQRPSLSLAVQAARPSLAVALALALAVSLAVSVSFALPLATRPPRSEGRDPKPEKKRERSTSAERAERAKQRELMELTRDHRTVFVNQLTLKVRERDLEKYFGQLGKVENVLLLRDKYTNRSKGIAYVEMSNLEDVPKVLMLSGHVPPFQSFPIHVKASEAEKNFAARKDSVMNNAVKAQGGADAGTSSSAASRIYCGNLHTNLMEDDLRAVFQAFGEVVSVNINRDEMGRSRGFGFIQFRTPQEANFALSKGNGLELAGNYLKLGGVSENGGEQSGNGSWKLEDEEGYGLSMNSQNRTALMAKLAGTKNIPTAGLFPTAAATTPATSTAAAAPSALASTLASGEIEGSESFCFVIKNMFDVQAEKRSGSAEWHVEIKQDVQEECENYGTVLHTYVEQEKPGGLVYVLFDDVTSATTAAKKLHGRWFNQRQISVRYLSSQEYVGMFPEVRSAVQSARAKS